MSTSESSAAIGVAAHWMGWRPSAKLLRWLPLAIIALGFVERAIWLVSRWDVSKGAGEADNAAVSFAATGIIGDTFARGSGASAHLNPIMPAVSGRVYRLFGIHSVTSEIVLALVATSIAMCSGYIFFRVFRRCGMRLPTALLGLALFCLLPLNLALEASDFRVWEGGLAVALSACFLLWVVRLDEVQRVGPGKFLLLSSLAALIIFINPALGLACCAACALLVYRLERGRRRLTYPLIGLAALCLVLAPWTIRNYVQFDRFIPLRSNAGIELAVANHPGLERPGDDKSIFRARLLEIHPQESQQAFERMRATGGEAAYADRLGRGAVQWISGHPLLFARQCFKHLAQYYFPPAWHWEIYGGGSRGLAVKVALVWAVSVVGLIGALVALLSWGGRWAYPALFALLPSLPYVITQPVPRYRYITYAVLVFLGCEAVSRLASRYRLADRFVGRTGPLPLKAH